LAYLREVLDCHAGADLEEFEKFVNVVQCDSKQWKIFRWKNVQNNADFTNFYRPFLNQWTKCFSFVSSCCLTFTCSGNIWQEVIFDCVFVIFVISFGLMFLINFLIQLPFPYYQTTLFSTEKIIKGSRFSDYAMFLLLDLNFKLFLHFNSSTL
jgi:hypothetical protein